MLQSIFAQILCEKLKKSKRNEHESCFSMKVFIEVHIKKRKKTEDEVVCSSPMDGKPKFKTKKVRHKLVMKKRTFLFMSEKIVEGRVNKMENKSSFSSELLHQHLVFVERVQRNTRTTNRILKSRVQKMQILFRNFRDKFSSERVE